MKKLTLLLAGLFFVALFFSCSKQTTLSTTDLLNGNWEAIEWAKSQDGEAIIFWAKEDHPNNAEHFPGIHLAKVYGTSNGLKIETTKFYHLQIKGNEITDTLPERLLLVEGLKITFFDKDGERDYTFETEIVELTDNFLWLKYANQNGFSFQYKYRRI